MKKLKNLFGSGPLGIVIIILLVIFLLKIEEMLNLKKVVINYYLILCIIVLMVVGLIVTLFSFISLPASKRGKQLVVHGPYKYVRHPIYSAVIFLFYPMIALLLKSWLVLVSIILVYLIFKIVIKYEEKHLIEIFEKEYEDYMEKVPQFVPRLFFGKIFK